MTKKELILEVPTRLRAYGSSSLSFTVRILDNAYAGWTRTCRIEGLPNELQSTFHVSGHAALPVPGDLEGELLATVDLTEPGGNRWTGAFQLTVDRQVTPEIWIDGGSPQAHGKSVVYQPIEVSGAILPPSQSVEGKVRLRLPLVEDRPGPPVALEDLLEREEHLRLPSRHAGTARILAIHVGKSAVVGRCYSSQLAPISGAKLRDLGESRVHWVTLWDDTRINQLVARFHYDRLEDDRQTLVIRNVTDYSSVPSELLVFVGKAKERLSAGEEVEFSLQAGDIVTISVEKEEGRLQLVRFRFEEMILATAKLAVFRTERANFPFPPDASDSLRIHFLGLWFPLPFSTLEDLLRLSSESFNVSFPHDAIDLRFAYEHKRQCLTISSNVDLEQGLLE